MFDGFNNLSVGQLRAAYQIIGGEEAFMQLLRGELTITKPERAWREEDGVIYFSLTSNGMNGPQWIEHLQKKGDRVTDDAKQLLHSQDFKPTNGVVYQIAALKGMLWKDEDRTTKNIRAMADKRKLEKPNAEVGCLIRDKFTDDELKAMGLWYMVAMHEPIKVSDGGPTLLRADRREKGRYLGAYCDRPDFQYYRELAFAFELSQVGA
ncbi:MAG: hypothetical protein MUD00_03570 [Candidatus Pacebacteria bacterium]|jgi:hypothetical protein|nr:hypothetical protein [Candidatus Paceibacterota bacterium]